MANFNTHLILSTTLSTALAAGLLSGQLITFPATPLLILLGTLAGILPDLDLPHSVPNRLFFALLSLLATLSIVLYPPYPLPIWLLLLLSIPTYLLIEYISSHLFDKFTVHRGNFHSLLAAACCALGTTALLFHAFSLSASTAWLAGGITLSTYLAHCLTDEFSSINFRQWRLKSSFGTACKLFSLRYKISTLLLMLMTGIAFYATPPFSEISTLMKSL